MSELEPLSSRNSTDPEWVWDSSYLDFWFPSEDAEFNVTALECWNYNKDSIKPSILAIKAEKKSFPISMVEAWLGEPYPSDPNQKLSSGFKILIIPLNDEDVLPSGMSRRTIDLIHTALGLPPVYRHGASVSTGADGMFLQPDGTYVIVHRNSVSHRSTGVTLRYDPLTNVTQGVFLLHEKAVPLRCFDKLASQFCTCPHPLLVLLAVLEASLELGTRYEMAQAETALREIELETGYDINAHPGDNAESVPARTAKLRTLIRRLGTAQSRMFFCLNDFREARRSMEFVQRKVHYLSASQPEDVRQRLEQPSRMLEERIEFLMSNLESALNYMAMKERMETQQSVVCFSFDLGVLETLEIARLTSFRSSTSSRKWTGW
ncbi:hypothetical protein BJX68DRAFT_244922 [Aspergillus pseudodeflectus]|uniref:Uncharacterized protein n=1 Tax=Aspergillus pseudodeflectus TaxID=176178 RepID=A0ABR4JPW6_9EURO